MNTILRLTVPTVAAGLLLAGCGTSDGTTTADPATATSAAGSTGTEVSESATPNAEPAADDAATAKPKGSKVVVDKANGYQFALPAGYVRITSKSQLNQVMKAGSDAGAKAGVTQAMLNKSLKLIAIKADGENTINVVVTEAGGMTADQLPLAEPSLKKEVSKLGAKNIVFKEVTLGGDPALRTSYTIPSGGRKVATTQYITVHDDKAYTLTFSQSGAKLSTKVEKQTTGSWRFL